MEDHGGELPGLKQDAGQLLRGTGWWLRSDWAVIALAKEAKVQSNAPVRAGTGTGVRKLGRSSALERAALPSAAQHCALR